MYRAYYGLDKKPFQISADPEFLWLGPKHKEGLAILIYGVRDNKGFLVLSGGVGTGKTTLIHALLKQLDDSVIVASVPDPGLKLIEFYNYIASAFGMQGAYTSKVDFLLDFEAFLRQMHARGRTVLLIIDEAQRLNPTMLEEIRLLSNIETPEQKLLNIFFVGQEEFFDILSDPLNRALRQRITINYHLNTLSMDETRTLIEYRLKVAGATRPIFSEDAIQGVYSFSQGAPRRINIICDHALLTGYVENNPTIGVDIIRDCFDELMLPGEKCPPCEAPGPIRLKPLSTAPTPSAAAIVKTTVLKAPPSPLKSKRERVLIFMATLLVVVITAYFYFKPQHAIAPPPGEIIAEARRAETSIDATVETADDVPLPSKTDETAVFGPSGQDAADTAFTSDTPAADDTPDTTTAAPSDQAAPLEPPETAVTASVSDHGNFDSLSAPPAVTPFPTVTGADETSDVAALQADSAEPVPAGLLADLDSPVTEAIDPIATESAPVAGVSSDPVHMSPPQEKPGQFPDDNGFEAQDQDAGGAESQPLADVKVETPPPELAAAVPPPPPERPEIVPEAEPSEIDRTNLTVVTSTRIPENETGFQPSSEKISGKPERSAETLPSRPKPSPPKALQPDRPVAVAAARKEPKSVPDTSPPPIQEPPSPESDDAISELTSVERLEVFLETYCRAYSTKDLSRFTALFTENAIERDVRFTELIPTYRANFEKLEAIDYQIDLQAYTESADGREVQVKGKFRIQYRLAGRDWKTSRGDIEMDLVKLENSFRVKRLDYRKQK